jgi:hypothetical protein
MLVQLLQGDTECATQLLERQICRPSKASEIAPYERIEEILLDNGNLFSWQYREISALLRRPVGISCSGICCSPVRQVLPSSELRAPPASIIHLVEQARKACTKSAQGQRRPCPRPPAVSPHRAAGIRGELPRAPAICCPSAVHHPAVAHGADVRARAKRTGRPGWGY